MKHEQLLKNVKDLIKMKGFTQEGLAEKMRMNHKTLSAMLNKKPGKGQDMKLSVLFQLLDIIDADLSDVDPTNDQVMMVKDQDLNYGIPNNKAEFYIKELEFLKHLLQEQLIIIKTIANEKKSSNTNNDDNNLLWLRSGEGRQPDNSQAQH